MKLVYIDVGNHFGIEVQKNLIIRVSKKEMVKLFKDIIHYSEYLKEEEEE